MREVAQRVVHPAHVPLEPEPQTAQIGRTRDPGPRRRLLGEGLDVGVVGVDPHVQLAQEAHGVEVLPTPVGVGDPLTGPSGVVEVEHRGHGVDPQAIGVVGGQPVVGRRGQEAPDLVAAVVEDQAVPVGVEAQPGVGVLVEVGPVEVGQRELVGREVRGHPVQDDPDAGLVELVDQRHQLLRGAVADARGEETGHLVAPRPVERVLHDRQQLDVGEAGPDHVLDQPRSQLLVAEESARLVGRAHPAAQVDLVDGERGGQ